MVKLLLLIWCFSDKLNDFDYDDRWAWKTFLTTWLLTPTPQCVEYRVYITDRCPSSVCLSVCLSRPSTAYSMNVRLAAAGRGACSRYPSIAAASRRRRSAASAGRVMLRAEDEAQRRLVCVFVDREHCHHSFLSHKVRNYVVERQKYQTFDNRQQRHQVDVG